MLTGELVYKPSAREKEKKSSDKKSAEKKAERKAERKAAERRAAEANGSAPVTAAPIGPATTPSGSAASAGSPSLHQAPKVGSVGSGGSVSVGLFQTWRDKAGPERPRRPPAAAPRVSASPGEETYSLLARGFRMGFACWRFLAGDDPGNRVPDVVVPLAESVSRLRLLERLLG